VLELLQQDLRFELLLLVLKLPVVLLLLKLLVLCLCLFQLLFLQELELLFLFQLLHALLGLFLLPLEAGFVGLDLFVVAQECLMQLLVLLLHLLLVL